jgi:hypothetical protein
MSHEKIAEELLAISETIEKQAAEVTKFVCDRCGHTSTLAKINEVRAKSASEIDAEVVVDPITVNDMVSCPAPGCDGRLSYTETEASKDYYFEGKSAGDDPVKDAEPEETEPKKDVDEKEEPPIANKKAAINYDSLDRYIKN